MKLQTKYNKLKTIGQKSQFILDTMEKLDESIYKYGRTEYFLGCVNDEVKVSPVIFKRIRHKLKRYVEYEEGSYSTYYYLKD